LAIIKDVIDCVVLVHVSALEALRNALCKFSTYSVGCVTQCMLDL